VDLQYVGYGIVGLFAVTWAIAFGVWKYGRIEEKWSARLR
jgi:high-affinity nickel-transport protein